jgi:hypothetical protein
MAKGQTPGEDEGMDPNELELEASDEDDKPLDADGEAFVAALAKNGLSPGTGQGPPGRRIKGQ